MITRTSVTMGSLNQWESLLCNRCQRTGHYPNTWTVDDLNWISVICNVSRRWGPPLTFCSLSLIMNVHTRCWLADWLVFLMLLFSDRILSLDCCRQLQTIHMHGSETIYIPYWRCGVWHLPTEKQLTLMKTELKPMNWSRWVAGL